jgi:hypothetical protein
MLALAIVIFCRLRSEYVRNHVLLHLGLSAAGALIYLLMGTSPDTAYTVNILTSIMEAPGSRSFHVLCSQDWAHK